VTNTKLRRVRDHNISPSPSRWQTRLGGDLVSPDEDSSRSEESTGSNDEPETRRRRKRRTPLRRR